ncbi:MAG: VCBS repeat-containing protein [Bacteroidota bacterium]|nr:VCBS repeat-containing protein [Bacteroidota bacterium]
MSELHKNLKDGSFQLVSTGIKDVYLAGLDWGDYDGDGGQDLVLCGETHSGELFSGVYRYHKGYFSLVNNAITPVRDGSVEWGDYDGDGDLDILLTGEGADKMARCEIYRNMGGSKFQKIPLAITPVYNGTAKWIDIDGDKDLDVILSGQTSSGRYVGEFYRNDKNDGFKLIPMDLPALTLSDIAVGDLDNDGDPDFIMHGESINGNLMASVFRNNGNGSFTGMNSDILGTRSGNLDLGDYDADGDLDLVITGETYGESVTWIYRNNGGFKFEHIDAGLPGVSLGGAYWGDYDRDGDADLLLLGLDNCYDFSAKIFRNDGMYEKKAVAKEEEGRSIWTTRPLNISIKPYYYFVYASCFCDPFNEGTGNKFHAFVSNIHYATKKYELMEKFNSIIMKNIEVWPKVDAGHRVSVGFETREQAEFGRQTVIREYQEEDFIIHYVQW